MAKRNLRMRRQHATLHTTHAPPSLTTDNKREKEMPPQYFSTRISHEKQRSETEEAAQRKQPDLLLLIEGSELALKSCFYLQCHPTLSTVDMTLDVPKTQFEGKFGTPN